MDTLPKPYYECDGITIYHADCREILPLLPMGDVDLVLTDPPYPEFNQEHGKDWEQTRIEELTLPPVRQFVFYPVLREFPLDFTAVHVWHKPNGQSNEHYERIFERNGNKVCRVFRVPIINYKTLPEWTPHPTQKPIALIMALMKLVEFKTVLDPFMGSGTTLVAAKKLGRRAIGIENVERHCALAVGRLAQGIFAPI